MGFQDGNSTDDFDRTETILGDKDNPNHKAKVDEQGNQYASVKFQQDSQLDAWGRLRTSLPTTLFELNFNFSDRPLSMNEQLTSGGTSTYTYSASGVSMTVPTTGGASVIRQTRRYFRYITGKGVTVILSARAEASKTNLFQGWGFFDSNDGQFFQYTSSGLAAVVRSSTSGTPTDLVMPQSAWNLDKLDGTGKSGITIDPTKYNVWLIDFAWQGAGGVRFGIFHNGNVIYCHEYRPSNTLTTPFNRTPVLPVRFEIRNTGTTASSSTMLQGTLGLVIDSSGQIAEPSIQFSDSNQATARSASTTELPILSLRPKLLFNGNTNRIPIEITDITVASETQIVYYRILKNATVTGGTWVSSSNESAVEVNRSATGVSGGNKIAEGYVLASAQGNTRNVAVDTAVINKLNFIGLNIAGDAQDTITIVARTVTSTSNVWAVVSWEEFQ